MTRFEDLPDEDDPIWSCPDLTFEERDRRLQDCLERVEALSKDVLKACSSEKNMLLGSWDDATPEKATRELDDAYSTLKSVKSKIKRAINYNKES